MVPATLVAIVWLAHGFPGGGEHTYGTHHVHAGADAGTHTGEHVGANAGADVGHAGAAGAAGAGADVGHAGAAGAAGAGADVGHAGAYPEIVAGSVHVAAPVWTYADELGAVDAEIARAEARAATRRDEAELLVRVAELFLERARLTGDFEDYAAAEARIADAFGLVPAGAGPFRTRAALHLAVHRIEEAAADLARCRKAAILLPDEQERIARAELDLLIQAGRVEEATQFGAALPPREDFAGLSQGALLATAEGDREAADAAYSRAEQAYHGVRRWPRAWVHHSRGLLDLEAGDPEAALGHFADAERALPGWWRVDEQVAMCLALLGREAESERLYRSLAARTSQPGIFHALAEHARRRGDEEDAAVWQRRAGEAQALRAALFAEAAHDHRHDGGREARAAVHGLGTAAGEHSHDADSGGHAHSHDADSGGHAHDHDADSGDHGHDHRHDADSGPHVHAAAHPDPSAAESGAGATSASTPAHALR